jgi:hypothetical protein
MASKKKLNLPLLNVHEVTFECTYGRGCDGICCQTGRPPVTEEEQARLDDNLDKFLPHVTPAAKKTIEKEGYLSNRIKAGMPMLRVVDGWCVFFNQGCVLHKVGAMEGDKFLYKPAPCSLFPLETDKEDNWYVRQHGYKGEKWDLFCLAPANAQVPATESLKEELALAQRLTAANASVVSGSAR